LIAAGKLKDTSVKILRLLVVSMAYEFYSDFSSAVGGLIWKGVKNVEEETI
jgi:hypothetical protein